MVITSKENDIIKKIKKLYEKKYRDIECKYIIEGVKIINEAYISNQEFDKIVICEEMVNKELFNKYGINEIISKYENDLIYVSENVFKSICDTKTPQGILALLHKKENTVNVLSNDILFLDKIQDSGNLGTILRSASAFGFNEIILNRECADIYSQKVLRASMGNIFKVNIHILNDNGINQLIELKKQGYVIYEALLKDSNSIYSIKFNIKKVIVVGNEANGISNEIQELSDYNIIIPMENKAESLNVAVATSIILSEIKRRR